jgi:hypothetical protein
MSRSKESSCFFLADSTRLVDFVTEKHNFDKPKNKTACLISSIDEAIYQADEVTK